MSRKRNTTPEAPNESSGDAAAPEDTPEGGTDVAPADEVHAPDPVEPPASAPIESAPEANATGLEGEGEGEESSDRPGPARTAPRSVSELHLKGIIESLVFVSDRPLGAGDLAKIARADVRDVRRLLGELREEYKGRGVQLDEIANGWQFRSSAANAPFVRELLQARPVRLTRAQIETLAIVAYRQPITRPEIDEVRGVDSGSALKVLLERELIRMLGRKEEVGRPVLYGTSGQFLEFFGLKSLRDLPTLREFTDLTEESQATLVRALTDTPEAESAPATPAEPSGPAETATPPAEEPAGSEASSDTPESE